MENYSEVLQQLQDYGLEVESLQIDTPKPVRCRMRGDSTRKKRGWYWLTSFINSHGQQLIVGSYGAFWGPEGEKRKVELSKAARKTLSPEERRAIEKRHKENQKRLAQLRQQEIERAALEATKMWARLSPDVPEGGHEYLARKRVGAHGVRFSPKTGAMAVPMMDAPGRIWGLQIIRGRDQAKGRRLEKEYWPRGLEKKGHFHLIGGVPGRVLLLAEGYATAATLHEATGLPVAVAFDAGNLLPVAEALREAYPHSNILVCADDDRLQKCGQCGKLTDVNQGEACQHCGQPHGKVNAGVAKASQAAMAVGGRWVKPDFGTDENGQDARGEQRLSDFNDLANFPTGGAHVVRAQVEAALKDAGWGGAGGGGQPPADDADGEDDRPAARSFMSLNEVVERFIFVDEDTGDYVFDTWTHSLAKMKKMTNLLPPKIHMDDIKRHPVWASRAVYLDEIGFDPAGTDPKIKHNLWRGWPLKPKPGRCDNILGLLLYLCNANEQVYEWVLKWLAYPLQHPGAKMHTALVFHGPQGVGKNLFFEKCMGPIYGEYAVVLNSAALEDNFNADWASRKLFVIADEVVASTERYHLKNQLKNLITSDTVRINPKNVIARQERNQMNFVFLSNEHIPLILEPDDRRHLVVWTPKGAEAKDYEAVEAEIATGGVEAFYHYLLNLDLGDFKPWTRPPMTDAKQQLIDLGKETPQLFAEKWLSGELGIPVCPALSRDIYTLYQRWIRENGEPFARPARAFNTHLKRMGFYHGLKQVRQQNGSMKPQQLLVPSDELMQQARAAGAEVFMRREDEAMGDWYARTTQTIHKIVEESAP
ncbi:DUF5906 domain-containing protein [Sulfurivirga sp.]|uniref:DUF5906 domain-containing protein n=1 Tax=Sulfurivirga sp. TaxID=2614236 RepID=UPI0025F8FB20|nr:DUF5906 domain-containing protein [Sulfurivirga sp.]